MKVSEAIDQLKTGDTVWVKGEVAYINKSGVLPLCIKFAERTKVFVEADEISLTEPQAEKVEARLAEHWNEDIGDVLWWNFPVEEPPYCGTPLDEHFPKYKTHFSMIDMPNEIEKPKRWVVKFVMIDGVRYFSKFNGCNDLDYNYVGRKENAHIFTDKAKAEAVATLVDGSVEEV